MGSVLGLRRRIAGQTTAEYAIVFGVVVAALVAMQVYVKRGLNARLKDGSDSASDSFKAGLAQGEFTATFTGKEDVQYEPNYTKSDYTVKRDSNALSGFKPTIASKEVFEDTTTRESGKQETMGVR